jgi:hypothetical protein
MAELAIVVEKEMPIRRRNMARYHQDFNSDESDESDDDKQVKRKKKEQKFGLTHIEEVYIIKIVIMKDILQRNISF